MKKTGIYETKTGYADWGIEADTIFTEEGEELEGVEYVQIYNLFVAEQYRGKGEARRILDVAIKTIKADHPGMEIKIVPEPKESVVDLERLASFYESMGLFVVAV